MREGLLAGRLAVITGGSMGIGEAICERFLAEGARLIVVSRDHGRLRELAERLGVERVNWIAGDVGDGATSDAALDMAGTLGGCDILVNNAGIFPAAALADTDTATAEEIIRINFLGVFHFCKAFVPAMVARGKGSVVNVTSMAARTPTPGLSVYAASKGAVEAFSRAIAAEATPTVRVNCLAPGPTRTETVIAMEKTDQTGAVAEVTKSIPMARYGECREIAEGALYLAGDQSSWMTGQTLHINGGIMMA